MRVKTSELRNNLSRYLRRVQRSRKSITVCDRDEPIAQIIPVGSSADQSELSRAASERLQAQLARSGIFLELPATPGTASCMPPVRTRVAPDGRTDLRTIDLVRGGRDW